ncbi:MAG: hypothetical protein GY804_15235 [Alphaproteobacteria bacterium]|nr:hypothetical protein [Alphaproteobacteria bacterium]
MFDTVVQSLNNFFSKTPSEKEDHLGAYPLEVHVDAFPERRYLWTMRRLAIICIISLCLNVIFGFLSTIIIRKLQTEMVLGQFVESKNTVLPMSTSEVTSKAKSIYVEKKIVEYIFLRHSVEDNYQNMEKRFGEKSYLMLLTSEGVALEDLKKHVGIRLNALKKYEITQSARITDITNVRAKDGKFYQVTFLVKRENISGEKFPQILSYQAVIAAKLKIDNVGRITDTLRVLKTNNNDEDIKKRQDYELKNPLGFSVVDYREAFAIIKNGKTREELLKEFDNADDYMNFTQLDLSQDTNPAVEN